MSKRKRMAPRNPYVAAAKFRKAGSHAKDKKALRREDKMKTQGCVAEWQGSRLLTCTTRVRFSPHPPAAKRKRMSSVSVLLFVFKFTYYCGVSVKVIRV